jgi:hypothetical protein
MKGLSYALAAIAIAVMAVNVVQAIRLRRAIVGGEVGTKWSALTVLIATFFLGYLASPLAVHFGLPAEWLTVLVFVVFVFGAVFVWVVMGIIRDTLAFLKLTR